ncbi:MAG: hypothetical protein SAJ37_14790 [Oscillatoria sp. PMC 1068.18]|nr:hypothetical protein [Oscillatoria sp. PMC 1076.18]MEC4989996.1 hypothetical protein [Oscillatoria sp. PMC 1068.18]
MLISARESGLAIAKLAQKATPTSKMITNLIRKLLNAIASAPIFQLFGKTSLIALHFNSLN